MGLQPAMTSMATTRSVEVCSALQPPLKWRHSTQADMQPLYVSASPAEGSVNFRFWRCRVLSAGWPSRRVFWQPTLSVKEQRRLAQLAENVRAFLADVHLAVITTINRDGSPHQTALWYELRGDSIVMNTGTASKKVRNLHRDPRASVCMTSLNPARHVTIEGIATFDEDHVLEDLTSLASRYAGNEAGPTIAANIAKIPHVTLILSIDKIRTFGKI